MTFTRPIDETVYWLRGLDLFKNLHCAVGSKALIENGKAEGKSFLFGSLP